MCFQLLMTSARRTAPTSLFSYQKRNYGSAPLRKSLIEATKSMSQKEFDKRSTGNQTIVRINKQSYLGPFNNSFSAGGITQTKKEWFEDAIVKEALTASVGKYNTGVRGHHGFIENGSRYAIEFFVAFEQVGDVSGMPIGSFTGFTIRADEGELVPIIITAISGENGMRVEVNPSQGMMLLEKQHLHETFIDKPIDIETIIDPT